MSGRRRVNRARRNRTWLIAGLTAAACAAGVLLGVLLVRLSGGFADGPAETSPPADLEGPVIQGARDLTVEVGAQVSYRNGVTVTDNVDGAVQLQVDASQVDLTRPGQYPVAYWAEDSSGNRTQVDITVTVVEPEIPPSPSQGADPSPSLSQPPVESGAPGEVTLDQANALADRILGQIINSEMGQKEKAKAIYTYVNSHIRYVGTSDKSGWIKGAYVGLTQGRGDCFNYFAASKLLLTRAGIPNVDVWRVGGKTDHYWQLVDVGEGYCHFDTCPHPTGYPLWCFLLTEPEVRAYTERAKSVRPNYYVYDYDACPVKTVDFPEEGENPPESAPQPSGEVELPESSPDPAG